MSDLRYDPRDIQTRSIFRIVETVEHLQAVAGHNDDEWLDLLQVSWKDYYTFRSGQKCIPFKNLESLAKHFGIPAASILTGKIDFKKIALARADGEATLPETYSIGAHGRMRSTITSIEFLERSFGWRLKHDVMKRFSISEGTLQNPFNPISIQLITDVCEYLRQRQLTESDLFRMGAYSFEGNRQSLVGQMYREMPSYREAFEAFATSLMPIFEKNCTYRFEMLDEVTGVVTSRSNADVALEVGVRKLGSPSLCHVKNGIWASIVSYFDLTLPTVTHTRCEHRGDDSCQSVFDFSTCAPVGSSSGRPLRSLAANG